MLFRLFSCMIKKEYILNPNESRVVLYTTAVHVIRTKSSRPIRLLLNLIVRPPDTGMSECFTVDF